MKGPGNDPNSISLIGLKPFFANNFRNFPTDLTHARLDYTSKN